MIVKIDSTVATFETPEFWQELKKIAENGTFLRIESRPDLFFDVKITNATYLESEICIIGKEFEIANILNLAIGNEFETKANVEEILYLYNNSGQPIRELCTRFEIFYNGGYKLFVGNFSAIGSIEKHGDGYSLCLVVSGWKTIEATPKKLP